MAFKKIAGSIGVVLGIMMIAVGMVGVGEIIEGVADGGTYGALFMCWGVGGYALAGSRRMLKEAREGSSAALGPGEASDPESMVLKLAAAGGGRVTIAEVAAQTPLSVDEATQAVATLSRRGMAEAIVIEGGVVVYEFKGLLSLEAKTGAVDILDS